MYDLFGAGYGISTFEFATGDGHQQLRRELRDEGEKDYVILDLALNESFIGSSWGKYLSRLWWWFYWWRIDFYLIGESDETKDHYSATKLQRGNGTSDY